MATAHSSLTGTNLHVPGRVSESDPGAVGAGHYWFKESTGELKIRNAANTGWVASSGGDSILKSTFAGAAAASNDGNLQLYTDAPIIRRDTGTVLEPWGPIFPLTAPVDGDFAWINQGGASVSTTNGGIHLSGPAATGTQYRIRKKAAPATPYTITAAIIGLGYPIDFMSYGLLFRQSSDGKIHSFNLVHSGGQIQHSSDKLTNETTFSATYSNWRADHLRSFNGGPLTFLRIADDGTNRICSVSFDGQNFRQLHSIGRTDFLTADEVGFYVNAQNATWAAAMTLLSWKQA